MSPYIRTNYIARWSSEVPQQTSPSCCLCQMITSRAIWYWTPWGRCSQHCWDLMVMGWGEGNIGPCQAPSPVAERHSDDNKSGIVEVHLRLMLVYRERRGHCTESLKYTHLRILLTNTFHSTWVVILLYKIQKTSLCFQRVVLIGSKISLSRRFFLKSFSFKKWRKCSPISINNKTIWESESLL